MQKNTGVEYVFGKVASLQPLLCMKMDCIKNTHAEDIQVLWTIVFETPALLL